MRLWMLGSGSRGNAVLLESAGSRVLIDAGFPVRVLAERLRTIAVAPESVEAVVITHEHTDHVRGACAAAKRWGWSVYATPGTAAACPTLQDAGARPFASGATVELSEIALASVPTPHDAAEPVAFVATERSSGYRAGIVYDVGHITTALRSALARLDLLVLEANHDEGMLRAGPYPPSVRHRIGGSHGHLSNCAAAAVAAERAHAGLTHVVLAHLSDSCNDPALAVRTVRDALRGTRFRGEVLAATQDTIVGALGGAGIREAQLSLF
ncbi:MAG TPA: MBL fold metallo-hydrolase [Gemmatimonadaceae bacterium]